MYCKIWYKHFIKKDVGEETEGVYERISAKYEVWDSCEWFLDLVMQTISFRKVFIKTQ